MAEQNLEQSIFLHAIGLAAPADRAAYLDETCRDNPALRADLDALLAAHDRLGGPSPAIQPTAMQAATHQREASGTVIGPYKLIEQIGEGGMGTVWMAQQTEPVKRLVAVKLIKAGMDSKQVVARFEAERQALALMDHANIARVLDAGMTGAGRPYFVMDLVKGVPITKYCDEHHLTPRQRLELFIPVCQAVQHAHQKGIIHRDLKPSNVLIALYDGKPVPKIIDFGVAKAAGQQLTDKTLVTGFGAIVGTPEYMSPEQAEINQLDIDTRSDVYSLGVLLYELLAGSPPFGHQELQKVGMLEMLRVIREQEPSKPSTKLSTAEGLPTLAANRGTEPAKLAKLVRGELDWIVMKALEKDRNRRYETANAFALDVERYLNDEQVVACPPSASYRLRKFARRNKRPLATAAVLGAVVLAAVASVAWTVGWANRDRAALQAATGQRAEIALKEAESWQQQRKWPEAISAVKRAEGLLVDGVSESLRGRISELRRDVEMVVRLEDARVQGLDGATDGKGLDFTAMDAAYLQAFADDGIALDKLPAERAAELFRARDIRQEMAGALDTWASYTPSNELKNKLLAIARAVDSDAWRNRVRDALWAGKNGQAELAELAKSDDIRNLPPSTLCPLGIALLRAGLIDDAVALLREAQQRYPDDFWINCDLAYALTQKNPPSYDEAIRFISAALAQRPRSVAALNNLSFYLDAAGHPDEAIAYSQKAVEIAPNYAIAHCTLGETLAELGRYDDATSAFRKAIEIDGKYARAYGHLASTLHTQGKLDEAVADYRKAIEINPRYVWAYVRLGSVFYDDGKLDDAVACYRKVIEINPKNEWGYNGLAYALKDQGSLDEAVACCRKAIELYPKYGNFYDSLGDVLVAQGKQDEAIAAYRTAIVLDPKLAIAHGNLGSVLSEQGKLDEAIACCRKAVELDPTSAATFVNLGRALEQGGLSDEAIGCYRKAIEIEPANALANARLGQALEKQGHSEEAVIFLKKSLDLDARNVGAHDSLVSGLAKLGRADDALAADRKAVELDPNNALKLTNLGVTLNAVKGSEEEAIGCFEKAIKINPKYARAHFELANMLKAQGQIDAAISCYRKASELDPWAMPTCTALAAALQEAARLRPNDPQAYYAIGNCFGQLGQWREAATEFDHGLKLDPGNRDGYVLAAALRAAMSDIDGYRRICAEIVQRFGGATDAQTAERCAKACLIMPDALSRADFDLVQKLAQRAVTGTKENGYFGFFAMAKALADYRASRYTEAIEWMERAVPHANGVHWDATKFAVIAMAQHKLGHEQEAVAALARAKAIVAKTPGPAKGALFGLGCWHDDIHAQVLCREAEALLKKPATETGS